jgi:hypothetical protein
MVLPNSVPDKEKLINQMEEQDQLEREERRNKIKAEKLTAKLGEGTSHEAEELKANLVHQPVDESEKYGGLTEKEI